MARDGRDPRRALHCLGTRVAKAPFSSTVFRVDNSDMYDKVVHSKWKYLNKLIWIIVAFKLAVASHFLRSAPVRASDSQIWGPTPTDSPRGLWTRWGLLLVGGLCLIGAGKLSGQSGSWPGNNVPDQLQHDGNGGEFSRNGVRKAGVSMGELSSSVSASRSNRIGLQAYWSNGLQLESTDQEFRLHVGGRLHADFAWWTAEDQVEQGPAGIGPLRDGANFRRARLRVGGRMFDAVEWITEYGFENGVPAFFDTYGELVDLPCWGNLRIGHFREPFSMDALMSGNHLLMLERSLIHDAFVPFRNMGIMLHRTWYDDAVTTALGAFRANSDAFGREADDGSYAFTSRITWTPKYDESVAEVLHLGFALSTRNPPLVNSSGNPVLSGGLRGVRFATRPELRVGAPNFADTGVVAAELVNLFGFEAAMGRGPWVVQSEYVLAQVVNGTVGGPPTDLWFQGFYVQAGWVITGEVRRYQRKTGVFGGVRPEVLFTADESHSVPLAVGPRKGAWEITARYSWLDLNDGPVRSGRVMDTSFGLNWHLNPQCRFMWNYILVFREPANPAAEGFASAFATRFQVDF